MEKIDKISVSATSTLLESLRVINDGALQIVLVLDAKGKLLGTVTDGDIRRGLLKGLQMSDSVLTIMNESPRTASETDDPRKVMRDLLPEMIHSVPVVDADNTVIGLLTDADLITPGEISTPVVLMAGGKGVRLYPLTKDVPKPMLKIGDMPILEIILRKLKSQGFKNIFISVNYLGNVIEEHVKDGAWLGLNVTYLHESQPLGTAGALGQLNGKLDEPFIVMNSDLLTNCDLSQVIRFHKKTNAKATLGVREYSIQIPYGVVNINGTEVESISEKPLHRSMVSAGIYALDPWALSLVPADEYCDMPTLLDKIKAEGQKVSAFPIHESWLDIGRHDDLNDARNNIEQWLN